MDNEIKFSGMVDITEPLDHEDVIKFDKEYIIKLARRADARIRTMHEREEQHCTSCWKVLFCKQRKLMFPVRKGLKCKHTPWFEDRVDELWHEMMKEIDGISMGGANETD